MANSEKTTFGVTIEKPAAPVVADTTPSRRLPSLQLQPSRETDIADSKSISRSTPSTPGNDSANPFSSRYYVNDTTPTDNNNHIKPPPAYPYNLDVESQNNLSSTKSLAQGQTKDCTMWPSPAALKAKAKEEKQQKSWNPLCRLGKKQKLAAQIIIALFIIGAAVGIGVGVSKAVGGGVWSGQGQSKPIPNGGSNKKDNS